MLCVTLTHRELPADYVLERGLSSRVLEVINSEDTTRNGKCCTVGHLPRPKLALIKTGQQFPGAQINPSTITSMPPLQLAADPDIAEPGVYITDLQGADSGRKYFDVQVMVGFIATI